MTDLASTARAAVNRGDYTAAAEALNELWHGGAEDRRVAEALWDELEIAEHGRVYPEDA